MRFFFPTLLFFLCACNGETPGSTNALQPMKGQGEQIPPCFLEGLYATSNAAGKGVENLFDTDQGTSWQTQTGAGPDEGIMLYFAAPTALGAIQALPTAGSFAIDTSAKLLVYVNGAVQGKGVPGSVIPIQAPAASSVYLRFATTGRERSQTARHEDAAVTVSNFPADASIGLEALKLFDKQNREIRLVPPKRLPGTVQASSTLQPVSAYGPENLFDARKEFVWVEGNAGTAGVGESLRFSFRTPVRISALQIWNGYQRSEEHFKANARMQAFTFGLKDQPGTVYTLADSKEPQKTTLSNPISGLDFELGIREIYAGSKYKDLAISDLVFYDGDQPFILVAEQPEKNDLALRRRSSHSPLETLLNRPVFNQVSEGDVLTKQSLILRSDGTFVLYQTETYGDDSSSETLADGNWELVSANAQAATVKIFGRWNNLSQLLEYYKGVEKQQFTRIFSDLLTIDPKTIKGQKMVGTFWRE